MRQGGGPGASAENHVASSGPGLTTGQNVEPIGLEAFTQARAFGGEKELCKCLGSMLVCVELSLVWT